MKKHLLAAIAIVCALTASAAGAEEKAVQRLTPAAAYFAQRENGHVTPDVAAQIKYLFYKDFEAPLYQPGAYFEPWKGLPDRFIRYSLAFNSYALANAAVIDPKLRPLAAHGIDFAIKKITQKRMWQDWEQDGFGKQDAEHATMEDAIAQGNIMFKGHLNAMYALFQLASNDRRYEKENTRLTEIIVREIRSNPYAGIVCEPDNYFPQCNSIGYLSLLLYDRIHGTTYGELAKPWTAWLEKNMVDPQTGALYLSYHPSLNMAKPYVSAYTTAWTLTLIHGMDPAFADRHYPAFKHTFLRVSSDGKKAWARETDNTEDQDIQATAWALLLAKEMRDQDTFGRLMNYLEEQGKPKMINGQLVYQYPNLGDLLLWAKTDVGTRELIDADWPGALRKQAKAN